VGIANIINNSTTTSGGEIIRELVNSSDGQGLHFDGSAGGINLGSSMPDLGTKYSLEFVVKGDSKTGETYLLDAYKSGARIIFGWSGYSNGNIQLHINGTWSSSFMATPDNGEVVHLVLSVDGTSAILYQNGNSVSTQTVVANTMTSATSTHIGCSQNGTANYFNGTIYRARFYNRTLSADEVRTAFERADVDFSSQYGSQAKVIDSDFNGSFDGWNTSNDWATQTNNSNAMQLVANAANQICRTGTQLTKGKRYRVTYTASGVTGSPGFSTAAATHVVAGVISAGTANSFEFTFPTSATSQYFYIKSNASGDAVTLDDISVVQIGAAVDLDLAFANPTQSLTVQDRSGAADGTASSSTAVTQVQPIIQGNLTSLRVGSGSTAAPADNQVLVDGGTVGAPAYAFAHTTNTGMWSRGGGKLDFATGGVTRLNIDSGGAVVVGDTPNAASGPISDLHVNKAAGGTLVLSRTTGDNNGMLGTVRFGNTDTDSTLANIIATEAGTKTSSKLEFQTQTAGSAIATRLTIDSTGQVSIAGNATADANADDLVIGDSSGNRGLTIQSGTTSGSNIYFADGTGANHYQGSIIYNHSTDSMQFATNRASRLTIDSTGLATFSNGIKVDDAAGGMAQIQTGGAVTIADDASITLSTSSNQGSLISVYHNTFGSAVLFYVTYSAVAQIISDPDSLGSASDTDGKMCMIKAGDSHSMTFKNRLGSSVTFKIAQLGGNLV
jgi:hypothetical protein